jgi:hypothetical protein
MRRTYLTLLAVSFAAITLLGSGAFDKVDEKKNKSNAPDSAQPAPGLSEERIDRILGLLKETNSEKAEELEKLRAEDPEKFKAELRETMQARFAERVKRYNRRKVGEESGRDVRHSMWVEGSAGQALDPATRRDNEYLEWLGINYPKEAKMLAELKKKDPDAYKAQMKISQRKYGRIAQASKDNPRLAEILKEDLELSEQSDRLLERIKTASDKAEKKQLVKELESVVSRRFDLSLERKQIRREELLENLQRLQEKIKQTDADIAKWSDTDFKNENVKATVEKMTSTGKSERD